MLYMQSRLAIEDTSFTEAVSYPLTPELVLAYAVLLTPSSTDTARTGLHPLHGWHWICRDADTAASQSALLCSDLRAGVPATQQAGRCAQWTPSHAGKTLGTRREELSHALSHLRNKSTAALWWPLHAYAALMLRQPAQATVNLSQCANQGLSSAILLCTVALQLLARRPDRCPGTARGGGKTSHQAFLQGFYRDFTKTVVSISRRQLRVRNASAEMEDENAICCRWKKGQLS